MPEEYDVFLCYNGEDRDSVKEIGKQLKVQGIRPWLDVWDLPPGHPWQRLLETQIGSIKSAAVFVGKEGIGPWQHMEIEALLREFVKRGCPVIPVLLSSSPEKPVIPLFLRGMTWVDFREPKRELDPEEKPLNRLTWAITGKRIWEDQPKRTYTLIASLGESPAVISAMYDLLKEKSSIDRLVVLCPDGDDVKRAYKLVQRALPELVSEGRIECEEFRFKDACSFKDTCEFLKKLYMRLNLHQEKGDAVYLSLAGGRKSMSALMAWMVPFFSCVEKLYHVIDRDEQTGTRSHFFLSVDDIEDLFHQRSDKFDYVMHPPAGKLKLVSIPFEQGLQLSQARRAELLAATVDDLAKKEYEDGQALLMVQAMVQPAEPLQVCVTEKVVRQFNDLRGWDETAARAVKNGLLSMGEMTVLQRELFNDTEQEMLRFQQDKSGKAKKLLHFFKGIDAAVRPIFYTEPSDVADYPDPPVARVVVCALELVDGMGRYRSLREATNESDFSLKGTLDLEHLIVSPACAESVLIVPLGKYPMVATQLYTLLKYREKRTIREVVLIYPGLAPTIDRGAKIIKSALWEEDQIPCKLVPVRGEQRGQFDDIDSEEACIRFQRALEEAIDDVRGRYPECKIDLALSGGRKGMTAMAIFAAQRKHISVVYHTVVADNNVSKKIESETTVTALQKPDLGRQKQGNRLFLREYCPPDEPYLYSNFTLFRIPVFPAID